MDEFLIKAYKALWYTSHLAAEEITTQAEMVALDVPYFNETPS